MTKNKKYTTVGVPFKIRDIIKFMAELQGKSQTRFLTEVINALFDASSMFDNDMLMLVDSGTGQAIFTFAGRKVVVSGSLTVPDSMTDKELDAKISEEAKKQFEETEVLKLKGEVKNGRN